MKAFLVLVSVLFLPVLNSFAQGSVIYQNTLGVGQEKFVFGPDPTQRFVPKYGGTLGEYAYFDKIAGDDFYAQLWFKPVNSPSELSPVPGSLVTFQTGANAGLIQGMDQLVIPGTYGGDKVFLELRVWYHFNHSEETWYDISYGQHGASTTWIQELGGNDRQGLYHPGTGSIANGLNYFSLILPEPSTTSLVLLGFGRLALRWGRRGRAASEDHRYDSGCGNF